LVNAWDGLLPPRADRGAAAPQAQDSAPRLRTGALLLSAGQRELNGPRRCGGTRPLSKDALLRREGSAPRRRRVRTRGRPAAGELPLPPSPRSLRRGQVEDYGFQFCL